MPVPQQGQGVLCNHQLFVGRHDVDWDAAVGARNPRSVTGILDRINGHSEPFEPLGDPRPDTDGIFADACGEDKPVESLQGGCQQPGMKPTR